MVKIIKFSFDEILLDQDAVSAAICKACVRKVPAKVAGICQIGETLMVSVEEIRKVTSTKYVIAPFPAVNEDEAAGEIKSRYYAGFSTIGVFMIDEKRWALFAKEK